MSAFQRFFKTKNVTESENSCVGGHKHNWRLQRNINASNAYTMYSNCAQLAIAVDLLAEDIADIEVVEKDGGTFKEPSEIANFLNELPNYTDLISGMSRDFLLTGNAFIEFVGNTNIEPIEIIKPDTRDVTFNSRTSILVQDFRGNRTYNLDEDGRWMSDGGFSELAHIKTHVVHNREGSDLGISRLEAINDDIVFLILINMHNSSFLENGARMEGILTLLGEISEDKMNIISKMFKRAFSGVNNAGKFPVLRGTDAKWIPLNATNRDMDFPELSIKARNNVFNRYKIPLPVVSPENLTFNNLQFSIIYYYENAVLPEFNKMLTIFNPLKFRFGEFGKLTFDPTEIQSIRSRRFEEMKSANGSGSLTINEVRQVGSYPDIEGGEQLLLPANLVPVAQFEEDLPEDG